MSESGGTTTQSGIYYQNSIAALYLGRLLDSTRSSQQRVESVRVEAPEAVDDIVVTFENKYNEYIQAKESLKCSSKAWEKMWCSFEEQASVCNEAGKQFLLILAISNPNNTILHLKETCERANGKNNSEEWWESLSTKLQEVVEKIQLTLGSDDRDSIFSLLKNVVVKVIPLDDIENDYCPNWIPESNVDKLALFSHLRGMVGGFARIRREFNCSNLLKELLSRFQVEVSDSPSWGVDAYKHAIRNEYYSLTVPGTNLSGSIDDLFMWPELYESSSSVEQYFEFEDFLSWREVKPKSFYDLRNFPSLEISQAVISAGAGFGKSTLLKALTYKLAQSPILLPVYIPLSELVEATSIIGYLNTTKNDDYQVSIDWSYMSSAGRVVLLFDCLDELSDNERQNVLNKIVKYTARFKQNSYLLAVRDGAILAAQLDAKKLEIRRLTDEKITEFARSYSRSGAEGDEEFLADAVRYHSDLSHLLRIPLFLSLVLAIYKPGESLPRSRSDILERYLDILLDPERFKTAFGRERATTNYLREATEYLAYMGLKRDRVGFLRKEILQYLRNLSFIEKPAEYLENLIKYGVLSSVSARLQFTYPTIQEYLAAQYMVENSPDEIAKGFDKIIHKPWAQAIQFALESHIASDDIIREQLEKKDDAFNSSLRLIARCVTNGAVVDEGTCNRLGERLAVAWPSNSTTIADIIGCLLLDGFTKSLPQKAEEYIVDGWALHYGGAKILSARKDNELTEKVLVNFLKGDLECRYHLHDWQEAVDRIAETALDLYVERALVKDIDSKEVEALCSLIDNLDDSDIPECKWKTIVSENLLPVVVRLVAALKIPELVENEISDLYEEIKDEWLAHGKDYKYSSSFYNVFRKRYDCNLISLIDENKLSDCQAVELLEGVYSLEGVCEKKYSLLRAYYDSDIISENVKFKVGILLLKQSKFNDHQYMIDQLAVQGIQNISLWCFFIGNVTREVALGSLAELSKRKLNKEDYVSLLSSLSAGLNYVMEPNLLHCGTLDERCYHSAAPEFLNWIVEKYSQYDFEAFEDLRILDNISAISPLWGTKKNIEKLLYEVMSSIELCTKKESDKFEWAIDSGLSLCERENIQLSEDCLIKIILLNRFNLINGALRQLLLIANQKTLETLMGIHNELPNGHLRGMLLHSIEKLSGRLSFRVDEVGGLLQRGS